MKRGERGVGEDGRWGFKLVFDRGDESSLLLLQPKGQACWRPHTTPRHATTRNSVFARRLLPPLTTSCEYPGPNTASRPSPGPVGGIGAGDRHELERLLLVRVVGSRKIILMDVLTVYPPPETRPTPPQPQLTRPTNNRTSCRS